MEMEVLNKLAKKVSELIGEPVETEEDNGGGYEYVIWIGEGKDEHTCSVCRGVVIKVWGDDEYDYCPYCGNPMDEREEE